ncbi:hypothetical protein [Kribbella endophytica]
MRTGVLAATLGLLMTVGLVSPAQAADPAPTNVKVAWASAAHTHVRVTWSETGSVPNRVFPQYAGGLGWLTPVPAAAGNQVDLEVAQFSSAALVRVAVYVGGNEPTSPAGLSVAFDTLLRGSPVIDSLTAAATPVGQYTMKWHAGAEPVDPNPGDPLDLPLGPHRFQVHASQAKATVWDLMVDAGAGTSATFTPTDPAPIVVSVRDYNEWSDSWSADSVDVERFGSVSVPAATTYGQPTVITGQLQRLTRQCDLGPCWAGQTAEASRPVVLHARADAASPWYVVGIVQSTATGTFRFAPVAWGTRQYRVAVPDHYANGSLGLGVIGGASTTLTRPGVRGGFTDSTATYGQRVTTRVTLVPPANVRTTLQRWDGQAWRDLKWVATSNGSGSYTFTATQRGRYAYRYLAPPFTYGGRPLRWQVSPNFVLTTS